MTVGWWLLPFALTIYLSGWVYLGGKSDAQEQRTIRLMRAGGAIPLSLSIWLIWWLAI